VEAIKLWITDGDQAVMNKYNKYSKIPKPKKEKKEEPKEETPAE